MRRGIPIAIVAVAALAITTNAAASIPKDAAARATSTPAAVGLAGAIATSTAGPTLNLPAPPAEGAVDTNMKPAPPSFRVPHYGLQKSANWAGYVNVVAPGSYFNDVIAYWRVPHFSCRGRLLLGGSHAGQWIGIDGWQSTSVEQEGDSVDCVVTKHGRHRYSVARGTTMWYEMYPRPPQAYGDVAAPGDEMGAETKYLGNDEFQLFLKDFTNGRYINTVQTCPRTCALHTTEAINEIPGKGVRAHFGLTKTSPFAFSQFYNAVYDQYSNTDLYGFFGISQNWSTIGKKIVDPYRKHSPVMATVSPLYDNGRDFSVYWKRGF